MKHILSILYNRAFFNGSVRLWRLILYQDFIVKSVYFSGGKNQLLLQWFMGRNSTAVLNSVTDDDDVGLPWTQ